MVKKDESTAGAAAEQWNAGGSEKGQAFQLDGLGHQFGEVLDPLPSTPTTLPSPLQPPAPKRTFLLGVDTWVATLDWSGR